MIGEKLSPILEEISETIIEFNVYNGSKPNYTEDAFRAATNIFMSVLMDKMWEFQEKEGMPMDIRGEMSESAGNSLKNLIKKYTDIDTHKMFKL